MKSTGNFYTFRDYLSYAQHSDSLERQQISEGELASPYFPLYENALKYMKKYGLTEDSPFCDHPFYKEFEKYDIDWDTPIPDFLHSAAFTDEDLECQDYLEDFALRHPDILKMEEYGPHILRPNVSVGDWHFFLRLIFASYGLYYNMKVVGCSEASRQFEMSVGISTSADDELFELDKLNIAKIIRIHDLLLDQQILMYLRKTDEYGDILESVQDRKLDSFNVCKFKAYSLYRGLDLEYVDNTEDDLDEELNDYMCLTEDFDDDFYAYEDDYEEPRNYTFDEYINDSISQDFDKDEIIQRYKEMYDLTSESSYEEHPFFKEYLSQFLTDWQLIFPDMEAFHPLDRKLLECLIYGSFSSNYTIELDEAWKANPIGKPRVRISIMAEKDGNSGEWKKLDSLSGCQVYDIMEIYLREQLDLWLYVVVDGDDDEFAEERMKNIKHFNKSKSKILREIKKCLSENSSSVHH